MKTSKAKLLRIRPFNMANFSSAGSVLAFGMLFVYFFSLPCTLLLWTGLAVSLKNENGELNYNVLIMRLKRIVIPICIVLYIMGLVFVFRLTAYDISRYIFAIPVSVVAAAFPFVGIYFPIYLSAKHLNENQALTKGRWFLRTLAYHVLISVLSWAGFLVFITVVFG
ncbi:MAG: hypothetical protein LBI27_03820 [Clostridiales bacterium]|jgi:hypothetical protein|nr:hypothetical protein [Clostridiales bacterium]